jgi:nicotinate-nucleotide adenylyltransferase
MPKVIGILGGSFNPVHDGHIYIAKQAKQLLGLDEVWLMVSPQNPNKPSDDMAPFDKRLAGVQQAVASEEGLVASDIEHICGTQRSYDTIKAIQERFPEQRFVWLMGADNLVGFDQWYRWEAVFEMIPIVVFARGDLEQAALQSKAASQFSSHRTGELSRIVDLPTPCWGYLPIKIHPASSTDIRKNSG